MMKHKVGDVVTIRKDLQKSVFKLCGAQLVIDSMLEHKGVKTTVTTVKNGCYKVSIDNGRFVWTDEMFEEEKSKTTIQESLIVDMDKIILKLRGLLDNESSGTRRAVIEEMIADMKINKNLL